MWEDTLFYSILVEQILTRAWASQSSVLDTSVPQKVTCSAVHSDAPFHSDGPFSLSSSSSGLCRISGLSCWSEILINFDLLWSIVFSYGEFSSRYGPYGLWRVRYVWGNKIFQRDPTYWGTTKLVASHWTAQSWNTLTDSKCHEREYCSALTSAISSGIL